MAIDNTIRNLITILGIALSIILLYCGLSLIAIAISNLFLVLGSALINYLFIKKRLPYINIRFDLFNRNELKELLRFGSFFQIGRIANTVALSADNIVIASVLGVSKVTPYSITSKLPNLFSVNIASKLPSAVFPAISKMFEEKNYNKLGKVFIKLTTFSVRLAIMASSFVFFANKKFITLWVGENSFGGVALNFVFIYWILQDTIYRGTTALLFASGNLKKWTFASIMEAILNILLSIILAKKVGLIGVALGTSISKTLTTGILTPYFICKEINFSFRVFIVNGIFKPFAICVPGLIITWLISIILPTYLGWLWIIIIGVTILICNLVSFEGKILFNTPNLSMKQKFMQILSL